ncbi:DNA-binding protein D-ETS-6-like [Hyposmocoma kahamanoa]|uniref:DNA-binding protein D-ETS-6-like n=1 Tax=Hyposmocoma kahamanoa TaxID=1477025 RepID=UPI000E6D67C3|nr:DNA-binding protein D-ETS-6-like [Hyposmocoma kahamanoa]
MDPPPTDSDTDSGDDTVPADPEKWDAADVRRCARWVARKFAVRAPRRHLLPDTGKALLALTVDNWTQVCDGDISAARIFHAYLQHAVATARGAPPPPPLPEHQQPPSTSSAALHYDPYAALSCARGGGGTSGAGGQVQLWQFLLEELASGAPGICWETTMAKLVSNKRILISMLVYLRLNKLVSEQQEKLLPVDQHLGKMAQAWRVIPCRHSHQDRAATDPQPAQQRGSLFEHYSIKVISPILRKHAQGAADPR